VSFAPDLLFGPIYKSDFEKIKWLSKFAKPATPLLSVPTGPLRAVKIRPTSKLISPKRI
jgi:hypothetical protein